MKPMLELMLFGLAVILRRNAAKPQIQEKLRARNRAVQVRTRDASVARYFVFYGGTVLSRRGVLANPDVALVWKDAATATRVLRSADPDATQTALAQGELSIEGDGESAAWFADLVRLVRGSTQSAAAKPPVAVIGLGRMGAGITRSLLRAGFPVTVYNRSPDKLPPLVEAGAKTAATPAAAARAARFVITSLANEAAVWAVVEGPDGILAGLERGAVHIGTSTISADATRRLAGLHTAHGSAYLAAPVLGRPDAAAAGELVTFVGGEASVFAASREILQGFTRQIQYLGADHAVVAAAKLAANYAAVTLIDLMGQIYAFGEKSGIPLTMLHTMFRMLWAQPVMQGYATRIWRRAFDDVGFDLRGGLKDVTLMVDAAAQQGVRWDFAEAIQRKMTRGIEMGWAQKDWSSVYDVTRTEAGLGDS
ncbi:MAG: NAD(P)-binding domain-containing protein [Burkholderiaceae bacterium]|jgi:3-hydroxyisobutyrate dehydrogenase-like beta-hydroxyacid dehydrogenase|nr:NAD(P)-binding domain-containing protein [Burkholderiaceae bacterium]